MSRIILSIFAVAVVFAVGQALECYNCDIGFFKVCLTTKTTCKDGEKCFSGKGKAAGIVKVNSKGCLPVGECNKTEDVSFGSNTTFYKMTKTCCDGDLCNSAPVLSHGLLNLAIASLTSLLMAKVLV